MDAVEKQAGLQAVPAEFAIDGIVPCKIDIMGIFGLVSQKKKSGKKLKVARQYDVRRVERCVRCSAVQ